jgi:hypothetical protein
MKVSIDDETISASPIERALATINTAILTKIYLRRLFYGRAKHALTQTLPFQEIDVPISEKQATPGY